MKYRRLEMSKPIPVMLDKKLLDRIDALSEKIGEAKSVVMRMAMRIGLDAFEKAFEANPADILKLISSLESSKKSSASTSAIQGAPNESRPSKTRRPAA